MNLSLAVGIALTCMALNAHAEARKTYVNATEYRDAKILACVAKVQADKINNEAIAKCEAKANKQALKWKAKQDEKAALKAKKAEAVAKCMTDTECEATDN
jgi:hypothetical protein